MNLKPSPFLCCGVFLWGQLKWNWKCHMDSINKTICIQGKKSKPQTCSSLNTQKIGVEKISLSDWNELKSNNLVTFSRNPLKLI